MLLSFVPVPAALALVRHLGSLSRNLRLIHPQRSTSRLPQPSESAPSRRRVREWGAERYRSHGPVTVGVSETTDIADGAAPQGLSLIHISEPTRLGMISYAV